MVKKRNCAECGKGYSTYTRRAAVTCGKSCARKHRLKYMQEYYRRQSEWRRISTPTVKYGTVYVPVGWAGDIIIRGEQKCKIYTEGKK